MFLANLRNSNKYVFNYKKKFLKLIIKEGYSFRVSSKNFAEICNKQESLKTLGEQNKINISLEKSENGLIEKSNVLFFDFQSTTPIDPRVLDAMLPYMTYQYGNPHSKSHEYGWNAEKAVETARKVSLIYYSTNREFRFLIIKF